METVAQRRSPVIFWTLLGLIFLAGLALRLYDLADPPLDFHPTRQMHSAIIARGMYYESHSELPEVDRQLAQAAWRTEGLIEPQVFERVVAWTYELTGGPNLQIPRLYSILFWMIGAGFLAGLALEMIGWEGALVASLLFLTWPYIVVASRSFQPDPLMVALILAGLWAALRWRERAGWRWALAAGLLCGLAVYIKAVAVFFVAPALLVIVLSACRLKQALRNPQVWVMALCSALPYTIYHVDGFYVRGYLQGQLSDRFMPWMWVDPAFYLRWISNLGRMAPFEMVLIALLGVFLLRRTADRVLLLALWLGYFLYGMTLPHHISTHDYYHLPFFPILALGVGAAAAALFQNVRGPRWLVRTVLVLALLAALVIEGYSARTLLKRNDSRNQARTWEELGSRLGHGASVIGLLPDYGGGLKYYGWINPVIWPSINDIKYQESLGKDYSFAKQFDMLAVGRDYFLITQQTDLGQQPELEALLNDRYVLLYQSPDYLVYDLRAPKVSSAQK